MLQFKHAMMTAAVMAGLSGMTLAADDASSSSSAAGQSSAQQDQSAQAQQAGSRQAGGQQQQGEKSPDGMFAKMAAIDGMKEVQLAQIAEKNASNDSVKQLAKQILQDHQQANEQLKPIAQKLGVQIPQELPQEKKEVVEFFQSLQGQQFDQEYISAMKAAHAHDVSKFQDKAAVAQNQELKQWVQQVLPKLQHHQMAVMAAAQQVGLPAGGSSTALGQQATDAAQTAGQHISGQSSDSSSGPGAGSSSDTGSSGLNSGSSSGAGSSGSPSGASGSSSGGSSSGGSSSSSGSNSQ